MQTRLIYLLLSKSKNQDEPQFAKQDEMKKKHLGWKEGQGNAKIIGKK